MTVKVFHGRSGGLTFSLCVAVSPPKTAGPSFPARGWYHARLVAEATQPDGVVMVNGVVRFGSCEESQRGQVERENDVAATYNAVGGSRS